MTGVQPDSAPTCQLLDRLSQGDDHALDALLSRYRRRLLGFIRRHLDPRVRTRVDPSDVVQETKLEVARRISGGFSRRAISSSWNLALLSLASSMARAVSPQ